MVMYDIPRTKNFSIAALVTINLCMKGINGGFNR